MKITINNNALEEAIKSIADKIILIATLVASRGLDTVYFYPSSDDLVYWNQYRTRINTLIKEKTEGTLVASTFNFSDNKFTYKIIKL